MATYKNVHYRLSRIKGKASEHKCVDCGKPAQQWSYNNNGNPNLWCPLHKAWFSTDLSNYDPRCRSCHSRLDVKVNVGQPRRAGIARTRP